MKVLSLECIKLHNTNFEKGEYSEKKLSPVKKV